MINGQDLEGLDEEDKKKIKAKAKRYNGLLEWVLDREGHEFLVEVDRTYIRDKFNIYGLREKFMDELNIPEENLSEKQFMMYVKHLVKSAAPTKENLQDEKYL